MFRNFEPLRQRRACVARSPGVWDLCASFHAALGAQRKFEQISRRSSVVRSALLRFFALFCGTLLLEFDFFADAGGGFSGFVRCDINCPLISPLISKVFCGMETGFLMFHGHLDASKRQGPFPATFFFPPPETFSFPCVFVPGFLFYEVTDWPAPGRAKCYPPPLAPSLSSFSLRPPGNSRARERIAGSSPSAPMSFGFFCGCASLLIARFSRGRQGGNGTAANASN